MTMLIIVCWFSLKKYWTVLLWFIQFTYNLVQTLIFGSQFCFDPIYDECVIRQQQKPKISEKLFLKFANNKKNLSVGSH